MNQTNNVATSTADREIVAERLLNAPRELVFQVWTDPEHLAHWWGPRGFTITTAEMDVRPGGVWRFVMHGPDGVDYPNRIVYLEIVKPERLVYLHGSEDEPGHFRVTVNFYAEGRKTRLTMQMLFDSAAEREEVVTRFNAVQGLNQTLDRLGELLATFKS
jgi:uncharacterized protein YndB with AHSA1/START domain